MSWLDGLNDTVASVFCDTPAVWTNGAAERDILIVADIRLDENQRYAYAISSAEQKVIGCPAEHVPGIQRKDTLVFNDAAHTVLRVHIDSSNWATIIVERVK